MRFGRPAIVTVFLVILLSLSTTAQVTVDFLDVGQGDAILIRTAFGEAILIDGGTERAGRSIVVPFLQAQDINTLTAVIATHPHADHIGGLLPVLNTITVTQVIADGQVHTTRTYERFLETILAKEIPFRLARAGQSLEIRGIDEFLILHPQQTWLQGLNNNSVVIWMRVGAISFLFTGDIERDAEHYLVANGRIPRAQIVKVAHHGSASSSTSDFLEQVNPSVAVIMVGDGNHYGHPSVSTLVRLAGLDIYRTDMHGTITITTDGSEYEVTSYKSSVALEYRLNLQSATLDQLVQVPGIGPVIGQRILDYASEVGFTRVDDLLCISGIGPATLKRVQEYFYVD